MGCGCTSPCSCSSSSSNCSEVCTAIVVTNSWNVPACDESAVLVVSGLKTVLIGSWIYNPTYGYFKITAFNSVTKQLTVLNECSSGNADPGTVVSVGTKFILSAPPYFTAAQTYTPTATASGAMTVTAYVVDEAFYSDIGPFTFYTINVRFTLGGVASGIIYITTPTTPVSMNVQTGLPGRGSENSGPTSVPIVWRADASDGFIVSKPGANFVLGTGAGIGLQGFYERA